VAGGCLINLLSSSHPHFRSFLVEGLWGFPDNKVNRRRWSLLEPGGEALLYFEHRGVKGVWGLARVVEVFERREPVGYWVERPSGFPLQVRLELVEPVRCKPSPGSPIDISWFDGVTPLRKEEAAALGVKLQGCGAAVVELPATRSWKRSWASSSRNRFLPPPPTGSR